MSTTNQNQTNTAATSPNASSAITRAGTPNCIGGAAGRPACAACKHQRRRCSPYCPLAPYFPAEKQTEFQNVHKLFGINNVVKLLKKVSQNDREDAMKSVIYEANLRAINPVGGCYTVIRDLQKQINICLSQLDIVMKNLAFYRARLLPNVNVYDQIQETNQERVNVEMVRNFCKNLAHEESSSSQVTDCGNHESGKIEMVQQFLNDKPT